MKSKKRRLKHPVKPDRSKPGVDTLQRLATQFRQPNPPRRSVTSGRKGKK